MELSKKVKSTFILIIALVVNLFIILAVVEHLESKHIPKEFRK
jgi:hypothetical protein